MHAANPGPDLKMENVVVNGFHDKGDGHGDVRSIIARLADCGASKFSVAVATSGQSCARRTR